MQLLGMFLKVADDDPAELAIVAPSGAQNRHGYSSAEAFHAKVAIVPAQIPEKRSDILSLSTHCLQ